MSVLFLPLVFRIAVFTFICSPGYMPYELFPSPGVCLYSTITFLIFNTLYTGMIYLNVLKKIHYFISHPIWLLLGIIIS